jgi:hypothetical protein
MGERRRWLVPRWRTQALAGRNCIQTLDRLHHPKAVPERHAEFIQVFPGKLRQYVEIDVILDKDVNILHSAIAGRNTRCIPPGKSANSHAGDTQTR